MRSAEFLHHRAQLRKEGDALFNALRAAYPTLVSALAAYHAEWTPQHRTTLDAAWQNYHEIAARLRQYGDAEVEYETARPTE